MSFVLRWPGEVSDWIGLGDYMRARAAEADSDETRQAREMIAKYVADLAVQVRVLTLAERLALVERARGLRDDSPTATTDRAASDREWMIKGVADIRGLASTGGHKVGDPELWDALQANDLAWLLAAIVRAYNELNPTEREAFFSLGRQPATADVSPAAIGAK